MRLITIAFFFAASASAGSLFVPPEDPPSRHLIVFYDVSRSVADDEEKAGLKEVDNIVDKVPAGTDVLFIPICANTDGAPPIRWSVESLKGMSRAAKEADKQKRDEQKSKFLTLVQALRSTAAAESRYSSCVSPSLRRVQAEVRSSRAPALTDVIIISDMIEECEGSVLRRPTSMRGSRFKEAAALVAGKSALLELPRGIHVLVVTPRAITTAAPKNDRPPAREVESFWTQLFLRCGLTREQFQWDADVSQYLETLIPH